MTNKEYSLKFLKLSRYATSLVYNIRDEMSIFLTGIIEDLKEQCRETILHDYMDLSRLMVHVEQLEERRKRKHTRAWNTSRKAEEIFQGRVVLKTGISPGSRRYSPTKGIQVHPRVAMIRISSLELRETMR